MHRATVSVSLILLGAAVYAGASEPDRRPDWRRFAEGFEIPSEGYCDQPYVVLTRDGAWLCVMTTGPGREGDRGQHIVATRSTDKGRTWTPLVSIEPSDGPEASWAMPLATPSGRVYVFYTYNRDNLRDNGALIGRRDRVDTLGYYAYKYSDDGGRTWSRERYYIPLRNLFFDYKNPLGKDVHLFWGIGKPIVDRGDVFLGAAKIAYFGYGFMPEDRGIILHSPNILTEPDPRKHRWVMLPEGDQGLGSVNGPVCDEHNLVALSDGTLYVMARTVEGHPVHYYSRDRGRTFTAPEYARYSPGGRLIRHPRACPRIWKTSNGRYLFWFHNNGHRWYSSGEAAGSRNLAWLSGGVEIGGKLHWSQPELVRYVDNFLEGCSYPDLIEQDGRYYLTATQKTEARVGEIPAEWLEMLWSQFERKEVARDGLAAEFRADSLRPGASLPMPALPNLASGGGFTLELRLRMTYADPNQILFESTREDGAGVRVRTVWCHALEISISDGERSFSWQSDPGLVGPDEPHSVAFIVDGGPKLLSVVVDGRLCDGGASDAR
ncbi:MAG TPA: exo-alpha-sialidase, partial [Bryobacterales bacterium]|nr:exo-alpha-sialidase [Bryobacterales bacterium]